RASAIDPSGRLVTNLDAMIAKVQGMTDMPHNVKILGLLQATRGALAIGAALPTNVQIAVSNAGGQSNGVAPRLCTQGIQFIDYYQAPCPPSLAERARAVFADQSVAAFLGKALGKFFLWVGDIGIRREVERLIKNELKPQIQRALEQGNGVLV